jgi:AAA15 family ATPase/GTPase
MSNTNAQNPHITKVHIKGYKSLRDTVCTFAPNINIVIGENGSGKTNLVESIDKFLNDNFDVFDIEKMEMEGFFKNSYKQFIFYKTTKFVDFNAQKQKVIKTKGDIRFPIMDILKTTIFNLPKDIIAFTDYERIVFQKIFEPEIFENDGWGYFNASYHLPFLFGYIQNLNFQDIILYKNFNTLKTALSQNTPIQDIQFDEKRIDRIENEDNGDIEFHNVRFLFKINDKWLTWNQLSDGTKRIYYVFSQLVIGLSQNLICILEEPELGIHPDQLFKLLAFIKENFQNRQIIITTHSPMVLNILNENQLDNIIVTKYDNEKRTTVMHHISEETKQNAKNYMAEQGFLSDFWLHHDLEEKEVWQ